MKGNQVDRDKVHEPNTNTNSKIAITLVNKGRDEKTESALERSNLPSYDEEVNKHQNKDKLSEELDRDRDESTGRRGKNTPPSKHPHLVKVRGAPNLPTSSSIGTSKSNTSFRTIWQSGLTKIWKPFVRTRTLMKTSC